MPSRKSAGNRKRSELNIRTYKVSLGLDRIACGPDLVADPPHGHDRRGLAELTPELANVDVDGAGVARECVTPDSLEELVARKHQPAVVEQLPQEIELLGSELDLGVSDLDLTAAGVDVEVAMLKRRALAFLAVGPGAAQDRLHACDELARVERLRHVVVGSDFEPDDLVHVLIARS